MNQLETLKLDEYLSKQIIPRKINVILDEKISFGLSSLYWAPILGISYVTFPYSFQLSRNLAIRKREIHGLSSEAWYIVPPLIPFVKWVHYSVCEKISFKNFFVATIKKIETPPNHRATPYSIRDLIYEYLNQIKSREIEKFIVVIDTPEFTIAEEHKPLLHMEFTNGNFMLHEIMIDKLRNDLEHIFDLSLPAIRNPYLLGQIALASFFSGEKIVSLHKFLTVAENLPFLPIFKDFIYFRRVVRTYQQQKKLLQRTFGDLKINDKIIQLFTDKIILSTYSEKSDFWRDAVRKNKDKVLNLLEVTNWLPKRYKILLRINKLVKAL